MKAQGFPSTSFLIILFDFQVLSQVKFLCKFYTTSVRDSFGGLIILSGFFKKYMLLEKII